MVYEIIVLTGLIYFVTSFNIRSLSRLLSSFTDEDSAVIWWLSLFFLPGIFLHEVSHLVTAEFLLVRTHELSLIPEVMSDGGVKLGSVQVQKTDPIRRMIIGIAPLLLGALFISIATFFVYKWANIYVYVLFVYIIFQVSHTCFSSKKDLEGFFVGALGVIIIFFLTRFFVYKISLPVMSASIARFDSLFGTYIPYLRDGIRYTVITDVVFGLFVGIILFLRRKRH